MPAGKIPRAIRSFGGCPRPGGSVACMARPGTNTGAEMVAGDHSAAAARERIAALQRHADLARLVRSRQPTSRLPARGGTAMLIEHQHKPGEFDPGHCRVCARATGLLDHYCRV